MMLFASTGRLERLPRKAPLVIRPATTRSANDTAISTVNRTRITRALVRLETPAPCCRKAPDGSLLDACNAGTSPAAMAARTTRPATKTSTRPSMVTRIQNDGNASLTESLNQRMAAPANRTPRTPPAKAIAADSASNSRTTAPREAPSATFTAYNWPRAVT